MNENEIMKLINEINYGWIDRNGKKHINEFDTFSDLYILQSPEELIKNKIGVCWDQVELERYYFRSINNTIETYFIVYYDNDRCPTHTFLTFIKDGYYYWFEHSWEKFKGIHKYNTVRELLEDVKSKFIKFELNNDYIGDNLIIREYDKPKYNISMLEFYNHCENGQFIDLENL